MNILIVDDERDSREEIEFYVQKYGGFDSCVVCSNALEALEQAEKVAFDIALLDIEMPVMNGVELAQRLLDLSPHTGIAFLTAYNHYAAEAFEVEAVDYVLKPIWEDRLFKTMEKLKTKISQNRGNRVQDKKISIYMFGKFTVWVENKLIKWKRQKALEIFAYLLENKGQPIRKELLCDLFWPHLEPQKALSNLQTTIYSIRKTLETEDGEKIQIEYAGNHYILHVQDVFIDVEEFENLLQKVKDFNDKSYQEKAINLYKGQYLAEDGWLWAEPKKIMLHKKYIDILENSPKEKMKNKEK